MATSRTSYRPGASGNPAGKAPGTRNRASRQLDELLENEAQALGRRAVELAMEGNPIVLKALVDRLSPPRKDRTVEFSLPPIETAADLPKATKALLAAVAEGVLSPNEAVELSKLVETHMQALKVTDLDERLARIEGARA